MKMKRCGKRKKTRQHEEKGRYRQTTLGMINILVRTGELIETEEEIEPKPHASTGIAARVQRLSRGHRGRLTPVGEENHK